VNEIPPSMAMVPIILGHCVKSLEELSKDIKDMQEGYELNRLTTEVTKLKLGFEYEPHVIPDLDPARYLQ